MSFIIIFQGETMATSKNQALQDIENEISELENSKGKMDGIDEQNQELSTCPYSWRRYFARTLDLSLYGLIWFTFASLVLNLNIESSILGSIINSYVLMGIMVFLEPFLLSQYGTTLGKWVFGLAISDLDGTKLTYKQALHRTFGVFKTGLGYNIPLYNLMTLFVCLGNCKSQEVLQWENGTIYTIRDRKFYRIIVCVVLFILMGGINVLVTLQAEMPLNKGNITPVEYYENCNDMMAQSKNYYGRHLNVKGDWIGNKKQPNEFFALQPLPHHELIISKGIVKGVRIELETDNDYRTFGFQDQKKVAVMSFFAAQPKMNYYKLNKSDVLNKINNTFENYSFTEDGVKFTNQVELKGYELKGDWVEHTGHEYYIHLVFNMERV